MSSTSYPRPGSPRSSAYRSPYPPSITYPSSPYTSVPYPYSYHPYAPVSIPSPPPHPYMRATEHYAPPSYLHPYYVHPHSSYANYPPPQPIHSEYYPHVHYGYSSSPPPTTTVSPPVTTTAVSQVQQQQQPSVSLSGLPAGTRTYRLIEDTEVPPGLTQQPQQSQQPQYTISSNSSQPVQQHVHLGPSQHEVTHSSLEGPITARDANGKIVTIYPISQMRK